MLFGQKKNTNRSLSPVSISFALIADRICSSLRFLFFSSIFISKVKKHSLYKKFHMLIILNKNRKKNELN